MLEKAKSLRDFADVPSLVSSVQLSRVRAINTRFPFGSTLSGLACSIRKLVGSFFNRHAMTGSTLCTTTFVLSNRADRGGNKFRTINQLMGMKRN